MNSRERVQPPLSHQEPDRVPIDLGGSVVSSIGIPADPARYRDLRQQVQSLRANSDKALFGMAPCGHDLMNQLFRVRGMEEGLMDLVANQDFACAFLDRLTETIVTAQEHFLVEVGDLIDVHFAADDLTGQTGPHISPAIFRKLVKPRWAHILAAIKSKTQAPIFFHSGGAVAEFLPDLIEIGVDIINPVHNIQPGIDPANIVAMFTAAKECGQYPIDRGQVPGV